MLCGSNKLLGQWSPWTVTDMVLEQLVYTTMCAQGSLVARLMRQVQSEAQEKTQHKLGCGDSGD